ncbi:hypothetical protein IPJ72_02185 [Candidatus Peregrinibacteria bacterium]|nr:MAG: hypothetical protein IPJ72_02185 [Candidatus Peregrinibacteria bacterium]
MKTFKQRHFFESRTFELKAEGVRTFTSHLGGSADLFVPYDLLLKTQRSYSEKYSPFAVLAVVFLSLAGLIQMYGSMFGLAVNFFVVGLLAGGALLSVSYALSIRHYAALELKNGQCLFVLKKAPSTKAVHDFLQELFRRRDDFLKNQFFHIDFSNHPSAEIRKFDWLRNEGVINDEEFDYIQRKIFVLSEHELD